MKVLKNAGWYEILTPPEELQAQLLRVEEAGRTCYQSHKPGRDPESARKFAQMIIGRKHESVLEHSCLTVRFNDLSRGFTHEQVRHRLTAISQESTRYVDYVRAGDEDPDLDRFQIRFVMPPDRDENALLHVTFPEGHPLLKMGLTPTQMAECYEAFYRALRKAGWRPEDARQFLPIGLKSQIVISTNFREWRHIFKMRCDRYAHWEIRGVMCKLLVECQRLVPGVFDDFKYQGNCERGIPWFAKEG